MPASCPESVHGAPWITSAPPGDWDGTRGACGNNGLNSRQSRSIRGKDAMLKVLASVPSSSTQAGTMTQSKDTAFVRNAQVPNFCESKSLSGIAGSQAQHFHDERMTRSCAAPPFANTDQRRAWRRPRGLQEQGFGGRRIPFVPPQRRNG
jgi:hypothetical protein